MFDNQTFQQLVEANNLTGVVVASNSFIIEVKGLEGVRLGSQVLFEDGQRAASPDHPAQLAQPFNMLRMVDVVEDAGRKRRVKTVVARRDAVARHGKPRQSIGEARGGDIETALRGINPGQVTLRKIFLKIRH